jgi:hypothetical protein
VWCWHFYNCFMNFVDFLIILRQVGDDLISQVNIINNTWLLSLKTDYVFVNIISIDYWALQSTLQIKILQYCFFLSSSYDFCISFSWWTANGNSANWVDKGFFCILMLFWSKKEFTEKRSWFKFLQKENPLLQADFSLTFQCMTSQI